MTREFMIGMFFGGIGVAGMVSCYLSKYRKKPDDDYEQKLFLDDLEHDTSSTEEFFDAETGSESNIIEELDAEVIMNTTQIIDKRDAETECNIQIIEKNENNIMAEQKLKSIEDTIMLLRDEMESMKRNRSKNRNISIRLDQPSTHCNQMHYCHPSIPPTCWPYPMPGSQPVYSVPMSAPPSVPMPPPPPPPPPVYSVPMPPPPPVHPVPMTPPPPPPVTKEFGFPPPPPPAPMMPTGTPEFRRDGEITVQGSSSVAAGPNKKPPITYSRIPITTEILKSVVLKPPEIFKYVVLRSLEDNKLGNTSHIRRSDIERHYKQLVEFDLHLPFAELQLKN